LVEKGTAKKIALTPISLGQIPPFEKGRRGGIFLIRNMKRCVKNFSGERKDHMYGELKSEFYKCL
jgi:hypothetical protein